MSSDGEIWNYGHLKDKAQVLKLAGKLPYDGVQTGVYEYVFFNGHLKRF